MRELVGPVYFNTPAGKIIITPDSNPDYPGIVFSVEDEEPDGSSYERDLAVLEGTLEKKDGAKPELKMFLFEDEKSEEYTRVIDFAPATSCLKGE